MLTGSVWCNEKGDNTCEICDQDHIGLRVKMAGGHCPSRWQEVTCTKGKFSGGFDISAFGALQEGKVSPRAILQRPMAGSQVPYCPIEKEMSDSWSPLDPSTFKKIIDVEVERVRGFLVDTIAPCRERLKILG
ncbi:hypothetical protein Hanom_Chr10g00901751 [Helianthus anomalus]